MTNDRLVYPALYGRLDLGFTRVNGAGLGNCLFTYSHAVVVARRNNARVITPAWRTIAVNAKLRGRDFGRIMTRHPDEIGGLRKAMVLAREGLRAPVLTTTAADAHNLEPGLTIIGSPFVFDGLHEHRDTLRDRIATAAQRSDRVIAWGTADYIAMHVRLGDFADGSEKLVDSGEEANLRIPMNWYADVARRLIEEMPDLPIRVFSNGTAQDLAPLLAIPGVVLRQNDNDVADLFELAEARVLVGSHSTFSRWAAFLGNMPTIWREQARRAPQPTGVDCPAFHVDRQLGGFPTASELALFAS